MDKLLTAFGRFFNAFHASRLGVIADKSAWLLMGPAIAALYQFDPAMATTLLQWATFGLVLAGVSIIISRLVFPQIQLSARVDSTQNEKNVAAALIVAAVVLFVGLVMLALVLWAKA